jgi:hypothetical protein
MGALDIADEAQFVSKRPSKRYGGWSLAAGTHAIAKSVQTTRLYYAFCILRKQPKRLRNVVFKMPKSIFAIYSTPNTFKIAEKQHEQFSGAS